MFGSEELLDDCIVPGISVLGTGSDGVDVGDWRHGDHHVIYVPAYSHLYYGDGTALRFPLTATLSVHNVSFRDSIWVHKIRYYDTDGQLVHNFLRSGWP